MPLNDPADRQFVLQRLNFHQQKFDTLLQLLEGCDRQPLDIVQRREARERMKQLQESLRVEAADLWQNREELHPLQRTFLEPALRGARAHLRTNPGTVPSQQWHADLSGAVAFIVRAIEQVELLPEVSTGK